MTGAIANDIGVMPAKKEHEYGRSFQSLDSDSDEPGKVTSGKVVSHCSSNKSVVGSHEIVSAYSPKIKCRHLNADCLVSSPNVQSHRILMAPKISKYGPIMRERMENGVLDRVARLLKELKVWETC